MNTLQLLISFIIALSLTNSVVAQKDTLKEFTILEYGFISDSDIECRNVTHEISKKWRIHHKIVAGCIVSTFLEDSVRTFNEVTYQALSDFYGNNWKSKYYTELKTEHDLWLRKTDTLRTLQIVRKDQNEEVKYNRSKTKMSISVKEDTNDLTINSIKKESNTPFSSQISLINLNDSKNDVIYKGFENVYELQIKDVNFSRKYDLECHNCIISKLTYKDTLDLHQFNIRPMGRAPNSSLMVHSFNSDSIEFHFKVSTLPVPTLYLNDTPNHHAISSNLDSIVISMHYAEEISLINQFSILSWELKIPSGPYVTGKGSILNTTVINLIKQLDPGSHISIICKVKSDITEITRNISGDYRISY